MKCMKCGKPLKDPFSIALGMGPECRGRLKKRGWKFPKPKWRVRSGRVEYLGMTGKIVEPPAVNTERKQRKAKQENGNE